MIRWLVDLVDLEEFLKKTAKKLEKIYGTARFDAINRAYADAVEKMGIIAGTLKTTAENFCHSEPLESETQRTCLHNTGVHLLQNDHQDLRWIILIYRKPSGRWNTASWQD